MCDNALSIVNIGSSEQMQSFILLPTNSHLSHAHALDDSGMLFCLAFNCMSKDHIKILESALDLDL
jgi:hypothetical protein